MIEFSYDRYVAEVLDGTVRACRWVRLACERHVRDLETGEERGLWFDHDAARVAIAFVHLLEHWKGEWSGQRIVLEPSQQFWTASLFGWKRANGSRRFRTGYLEVGRKNAKTTTAAAWALFLAFVEGEPGAEVYSVATKRDQAKIVHKDATMMVRRSPQLRQLITAFRDNLHSVETGSKFEPLSSDHNSLDGLNIHGAVADELHAWPSADLWGVIRTATGSRRQPLVLAITTAGVNQQGICYQQRDYLGRVLKGLIADDSYWGMIYTIDTKKDWNDLEGDDDWRDEQNWVKANPLLGVSKKVSTMREGALEAVGNPASLNQFLRWHLNVWTNAVTRWVNPVHWAACGEFVVDEAALEGRVAFGGLDLSSVEDVTAFVLVFPPEQAGEPYQVLARMWLPDETMPERVRKASVPYDVWVREGWLRLTPGNRVDYDFIVAEIEQLAQRYDVQELAYDRYGAALITQRLQELGGDDWVVPMGQGSLSMTPPMRELARLLAGGEIAHGGNPVLGWMADNVVAVQDAAGNIKPDKSRSSEKIDGIVALLMALDRATRWQGNGADELMALL